MELLQPARLVVVEKQVKEEREERISEIVNYLVKDVITDTEQFFEKLSEVFHVFHIMF